MNNILKLIIIISSLNASNCFAFNETITHPDITKKAFSEKASGLGTYLIDQLGLQSGINTLFLQQNILFWLQFGSTEEDIPTCRAANHFHNPLLPWDQSQSTDVWPQDQICQLQGWTPRYSNITWATGLKSPTDTPNPRNKQSMGYDDARRYFYNSLISFDVTTREALLAKTFQAVGQSLHLLQDMAVPAHVRNDFLSHLIYSGITRDNLFNPADWVANPFEAYVKNNTSLVSSITQIPSYAITGAIVSDFWDTDVRAGAPFPQGLAEYTNASYFSDFTIPGNPHIPFVQAHTFASPQVPTNICVDNLPGSARKRKYASRVTCPADGSPVDHFAAISMFTPRLIGAPPLPFPFINKYALDDNVHNTYAAGSNGLLAKAVGYSAALLDYFFRGNINVTVNPTDITFRTVKLTAKNMTPNETMGAGEAMLVIRYKALPETPLGGAKYLLNYPPEETSPDKYSYKISKPQNVDLTNPQVLTFDFSDNALPYFFDDITMQLVFKGKLGNEDGAVAVSELKPIDGIYSDIDISLPSSGVYAKTSDGTLSATFNELRVTTRTDIPGGLTGGSFELVLEYNEATSDPFQSQPVDTEPANAAGYVIRVAEKNGVSALQPGLPVDLVFDLTSPELPVKATDVYMNIVYKSSSTSKPVAVGYLDISEPTPVDVFNNADKYCIYNKWYDAGTPEILALLDTNGNRISDYLDLYANNFYNIYFKESSIGNPVLASNSNYTFQSPEILYGGDLRRLGFILTDYNFNFSVIEGRYEMTNTYPEIIEDPATMYPGSAIKNQIDAEGTYTHPSMMNIRGKKIWWGASLIYSNFEYPASSSCSWDALNQPSP